MRVRRVFRLIYNELVANAGNADLGRDRHIDWWFWEDVLFGGSGDDYLRG